MENVAAERTRGSRSAVRWGKLTNMVIRRPRGASCNIFKISCFTNQWDGLAMGVIPRAERQHAYGAVFSTLMLVAH
ncbi:Cocaine- and amphetamine-regulated transcript protein [Frankliniella fusca]|uniref:Cocaine- and amphetamine-regulated transcript protein n=1 Tax=Frankliniella fusca TaxID=407009 RepID=A0AAE1LKA5_9NEOP|nr:Cocaine- and amphetamine-regulated transcript protein [Frankliniella fusca]KAK3922626.1 Cocaine- and amphetamine-regulated transcript protein [Frankliniella fusca]